MKTQQEERKTIKDQMVSAVTIKDKEDFAALPMAQATPLPKMIPDALHASTNFPFMQFLKSFLPLSCCQLSSLDAPFSFL